MMRRRLFVGLIAAVGLWACDETNPAQPDTEPQMAVVPVSVAAAPAISTLTITVSASDIASDLVFNVTMTNGEATDTITIPAGSDRTITIRGYDASNIETHRGSKTVNLTEGVNPQLTVVLEGLTGDQPLVVALGETTLTVSPETATVSVGGTTQLAAVVTDEAGDTLAVSVRWASSHPAVATVDDAGLVSGISLGSASIIATYGGVGASAAVTVSDAVFPTEGLVAWYPFNGNANDESGNGLHGTVSGALATADRMGEPNAAYEFNGTTSEINVGHSALFDAPSITVSAWIERGTLDTYCGGIVGKLTAANLGWWLGVCRNPALGQATDTLVWSGNSGEYWGRGFGAAPTFGEWHHVAGTFSEGTVRAYLDGELVDETSTSASLLAPSEPLRIGYRVGFSQGLSVPEYYWAGKIDDVGIWNRALTPEEIAYLSNN